MEKWAEHALLLQQHGDLLLAGIHAIKMQFDSSSSVSLMEKPPTFNGKPLAFISPSRLAPAKPSALMDSKLKPIIETILEKFPEVGDISRLEGYEYFKSNAKSVQDSLRPFYDFLCSLVDFFEISEDLMETFSDFTFLSCEIQQDLIVLLLRIFVNYASAIFLISTINNELLASALLYARSFALINGQPESRAATISNMLYRLFSNNPFKCISEQLEKMCGRPIVESVSKFKLTVFERISVTSDKLSQLVVDPFKDDSMSPTLNKAEDATTFNLIQKAVFLSFLSFPSLFVSNLPRIDLVARTMQYSAFAPLIRNEYIDLMLELEKLAQVDQICNRAKVLLGESSCLPTETYGKFHGNRRILLLATLQKFEAAPVNVLLKHSHSFINLLVLSRSELVWYLINEHIRIQQNKPNQKKSDDFVQFTSTIYKCFKRIFTLKEELLTNWEGYIESFLIPDSSELARVLYKGELNTVLESLTSILNTSVVADQLFLKATTAEWFVVQQKLAVQKQQPKGLEQFCGLMKEISFYQRILADFDGFIQDNCSLSFIYFFQSVLHDNFKGLLESNEDSMDNSLRWSDLSIFITIASDFNGAFSRFWPIEHEFIGVDSCLYVQEMLSAIGQCGSLLAHDLGVFEISFAKQKSKTLESADFGRKRNEMIQSLKFKLTKILQTLDRQLLVHDSQFNCRQYFLDSLATRIKSFISSNSVLNVAGITTGNGAQLQVKRPSLVTEELNSYFRAILEFDVFVKGSIISQISILLQEQTNTEIANKIIVEPAAGNRASFVRRPTIIATDSIRTLLSIFVGCYMDVASGGGELVSKEAVENYKTEKELESLCILLGFDGIKYLNQHLVDKMVQLVLQTRDFLQSNLSMFRVVEATGDSFISFTDSVFNQKEPMIKTGTIDQFIQLSSTIGHLVDFRKKLNRAHLRIMSSRHDLSMFVKGVISIQKQHANAKDKSSEIKLIDSLACQFGNIDPDSEFLRALNIQYRLFILIIAQMANETHIWSHLTTLYGLGAVQVYNSQGNFKSFISSFDFLQYIFAQKNSLVLSRQQLNRTIIFNSLKRANSKDSSLLFKEILDFCI